MSVPDQRLEKLIQSLQIRYLNAETLSEGSYCEEQISILSELRSLRQKVIKMYRHNKRGTRYELIGFGRMQAENWLMEIEPVNATGFAFGGPALVTADMQEVAIYRNDENPSVMWVRPRSEFEDGRFEEIDE